MNARRILIVDDNPTNVVIAETVLMVDGFDVASAKDAQEALREISLSRPALILMDLQLPGVDGFQLTRQIKAEPSTRDIVIVAFTALAMHGDAEKAHAAGCDGYITKPIDVNRFAPQVRALIGPGSDARAEEH